VTRSLNRVCSLVWCPKLGFDFFVLTSLHNTNFVFGFFVFCFLFLFLFFFFWQPPPASVTVSAAGVRHIRALSTTKDLLFALSNAAGCPDVAEDFAFLARWDTLRAGAKLALLASHGCHGLHLFIHRRDPVFFRTAVAPHMSQALGRSFMDSWLLGEDTTDYVLGGATEFCVPAFYALLWFDVLSKKKKY
jgi:hypothetical protein